MAFAADVFREPLANPSEALGDAVRKDVGEGFCKPFGEAFRESFCVSLAKPLFGVCHCYSTWRQCYLEKVKIFDVLVASQRFLAKLKIIYVLVQ